MASNKKLEQTQAGREGKQWEGNKGNKYTYIGWYSITVCIEMCIGSGWNGVNFPIAALVVLCFVFVARRVLITDQCFGYC